MEQSTSYRSHTCGELRMEHAGQQRASLRRVSR